MFLQFPPHICNKWAGKIDRVKLLTLGAVHDADRGVEDREVRAPDVQLRVGEVGGLWPLH